MRIEQPRPWFLILSTVLVAYSAAWIVLGPDLGVWLTFLAWDVLITWLVCLGFAVHNHTRPRKPRSGQ
ncbi:hypothetical protein MRI28_20375 [Nocardiopsis dassonvillei]|uniref:hypothetical protein n=1 Tax=Nocardiopsis dassonvillei TaxID=2014 RepID=UPI00200D353E|nr:hypothetical protein [Nocardiopsis dassonvillei]MCK9871965.1 hypothetical protein [Nocardiopsis dassonvillei]